MDLRKFAECNLGLKKEIKNGLNGYYVEDYGWASEELVFKALEIILNSRSKEVDGVVKYFSDWYRNWLSMHEYLYLTCDRLFMNNKSNIKKCSICPENVGMEDKNGFSNRLPCGQCYCWVKLHCDPEWGK